MIVLFFNSDASGQNKIRNLWKWSSVFIFNSSNRETLVEKKITTLRWPFKEPWKSEVRPSVSIDSSLAPLSMRYSTTSRWPQLDAKINEMLAKLEGSNWRIKQYHTLFIEVYKTKNARGSSYIPLPENILTLNTNNQMVDYFTLTNQGFTTL